MANVLIIDDEKTICDLLSHMVKNMGHEVTYALSLGEGLKEVSSKTFDVVFLDVRLPDGDGLKALPKIVEGPLSPEVIIITGQGDPDGAELAIKSGAWAYIEKPATTQRMTLPLVRALQYRAEKAATKPAKVLKREGIVGISPQLQECLDLLAHVASSNANVLITGETGTGKELFAKTIHDNSLRAEKNFVVVDCTALPETLVESILFGHEKGVFTGADKARIGLVKEADGGTLFLDEVGELPLSVQKDFLRVLQEYRFRPLGSPKEVKSDFRLLSATNRNLEKMVELGQFRQDLFFRLRSLNMELPPLRSRPQDIKDLTVHYLNKLCERYEMETKGFSPDFLEAMMAYDWPGNVRELFQTIERVLTIARFEPTLFPQHLPTQIRVQEARASVGRERGANGAPGENDYPAKGLPRLQDVREAALSKVETQYLENLMMVTEKDIKEACRISGLSRSRLYHLLQKYKISRA